MKSLLDHIFGSKTRAKLLGVLMTQHDVVFSIPDLVKSVGAQKATVTKEVTQFEKFGLVKQVSQDDVIDTTVDSKKNEKPGSKKSSRSRSKYYTANQEFLLYPELKALMFKAHLILERDFIAQIEQLPRLKLFILTGIFLGHEAVSTDMLIVGSVNRKDLARIIKKFEKELQREINYTILSTQEYLYRKEITDKFLFDIIGGKKLTVLDRL